MEIYKCTICGHEYDPARGDIARGIKPDTPFETLPGNWTCPVCGAAKEAFRRLEG